MATARPMPLSLRHRRPPGELVAAPIAVLAVVGLGRHFGFSAGRLYLILIGLALGAPSPERNKRVARGRFQFLGRYAMEREVAYQ